MSRKTFCLRAAHNHAMMHELTPADLDASMEADRVAHGEDVTWRQVHWTEAHQMIKDGVPHTTDLYVDNGRIRRAGPATD